MVWALACVRVREPVAQALCCAIARRGPPQQAQQRRLTVRPGALKAAARARRLQQQVSMRGCRQVAVAGGSVAQQMCHTSQCQQQVLLDIFCC